MSLLEVKNISKSFGKNVVIKDFSLSVKKGEFVILSGESGSGKSTVLNILGLLSYPDFGEIYIEGQKVKNNIIKNNKLYMKNKFSYLFQNYALINNETVEDNIMVGLEYLKTSKINKKKKVEEALKYVGLSGYKDKKIYQLSGGEQQRVAIARILVKPSKIIFADEPTGSLDKKNRDLIFNLLLKLNNEGKTIIMVTHDEELKLKVKRVIKI